MTEEAPFRKKRSWARKFHDAFRGVLVGISGQGSFRVHFLAAGAVIVAAALMKMSLWAWCVLLLSITVVLAAEMFNSALESMARSITDEYHPDLGDALDIGSASVLVACLGSSLIGAIVFLHRLGELAGWWP